LKLPERVDRKRSLALAIVRAPVFITKSPHVWAPFANEAGLATVPSGFCLLELGIEECHDHVLANEGLRFARITKPLPAPCVGQSVKLAAGEMYLFGLRIENAKRP